MPRGPERMRSGPGVGARSLRHVAPPGANDSALHRRGRRSAGSSPLRADVRRGSARAADSGNPAPGRRGWAGMWLGEGYPRDTAPDRQHDALSPLVLRPRVVDRCRDPVRTGDLDGGAGAVRVVRGQRRGALRRPSADREKAKESGQESATNRLYFAGFVRLCSGLFKAQGPGAGVARGLGSSRPPRPESLQLVHTTLVQRKRLHRRYAAGPSDGRLNEKRVSSR